MSRVIGRRVEALTFRQAWGISVKTPLDPEKARESYLDKLVKYVPAEVTALSAGLFAAFPIKGKALWVAMVILAALNVLYLLVNARQTQTQPRWYFYILATLAFVAWAVSTVDAVASAFHASTEAQRAFVLAAAAFLVPLIHSGVERRK